MRLLRLAPCLHCCAGAAPQGIILESFGVGNMPDAPSAGWVTWLRSQTRKGLKVRGAGGEGAGVMTLLLCVRACRGASGRLCKSCWNTRQPASSACMHSCIHHHYTLAHSQSTHSSHKERKHTIKRIPPCALAAARPTRMRPGLSCVAMPPRAAAPGAVPRRRHGAGDGRRGGAPDDARGGVRQDDALLGTPGHPAVRAARRRAVTGAALGRGDRRRRQGWGVYLMQDGRCMRRRACEMLASRGGHGLGWLAWSLGLCLYATMHSARRRVRTGALPCQHWLVLGAARLATLCRVCPCMRP